MSESDEKRQLYEKVTRKLMGLVGEGVLDFLKASGIGVTIFAFDFGDDGHIAYISSAERSDMIRSLKNLITYLEAGLLTDPPGESAKA